MSFQVDKLKAQLAEVKKNNGAGIDDFFEQLWQSGVAISANDVRMLSEDLFAWLQLHELEQARNYNFGLLSIGVADYFDGKYEIALKHLSEAQKLFSDMKDEDGIQCCNAVLSAVYRPLGELELAVKYALEAFHYFSKGNQYRVFYGYCVYGLAEMYSETGRLDDSLRFYEFAIKMLEPSNNQHMIARVMIGMAVVFQRQKKYALAEEYFNRSLAICEAENSLAVKARVLTDIGMYYFEMGDFALAAQYEKEALDLRETLKIPNAPITNYIHLGEIYFKQGKTDDAIAVLNKGLIIAEELLVKPKIFQLHWLLSEVYEAKGEANKSLLHHKAFHRIREEVQHEDNEKKIRNLHLIFEAEQTQKENTIIKAQKKEIERKNVELQHTIDELTRTRISKKAKTFTLVIAIILFITEDLLLKFTEGFYDYSNYFMSLGARGIIVLSLKPIEKIVESYLLRRIMKEKLVLKNE